jgi:hypothetical protein
VIVAALVAVKWPGTFFDAVPQGTVSHQVWAVGLKLSGSYVLAMVCWVALLAWAATLLSLARGAGSSAEDDEGGEPAPVPALVGAPDGGKSASVRLPLP